MLLLLKIKPLVFVVILFQCVFYVTCGCSNEYDDVWCTSKKDEVVALCMRGEFKSVCDGSYLSTFYENNLDCPTDGYCNAEKIDHCKNNPCKNSGECIPLFGSYLCVCDSDHHGMDCAQSGTGKYVKEVYFVPAIMTIPKPVSHFGSSLVFIKDLGSHLSMFFTSESSGEAAIIHEQQFLKTENGRKECWAHANDKRRLLWEIEYMLKFCEDVPEEPMYYVAIFHTVLYKPSSKVLIENYPKSTSKLFAYDSHGLTIKILNRRSEEFRRKFYQIIIYRALVCPTLLKLEMCGNFYLTRKKIDRRQSNIIRSIFEKNEVCPTPNTEYNWEIYNYKSGHINEFPQSLDLFIPASNMFKVQPYSLKIGVYQIALTIFSEGGSPTFGKYSTANNGLCFLEIKRLELYAVIKGGSERTIAESETVIFDATGCYDPNEPLNYQTHLQWSWSCDDPSEDFCKFRTVREGLYKINKRLTKGKTYIFTLRLSTMTGEDDRKEVTQTITVTKNPQPQLEINCLKNCGFNNFKTNRKEVVYLEVTVLNKLDINDISWKYSIGDGPENDVNDLKLDGVDDRILIVKENVLQLDSTYTFFVKAKSNDGVDVQSNIKIMVNSEPKLGECTIQSVTGELVAGLAQFDITCTGFRDRNTIGGQLNYEFYQMSSKNAGLGTLLGYSITGRIENVILTEGTVRVKVSDTYGMYVDYFTTVELEKIESTSEETKVLFSTLSLLASIGDTSGSVRAAGALIDVMEDVLDKRNLITDILETLETDTVRDIYDAKLYSSTLRKITIEGLSQLKDGFDSKGVKSMGSLMFSVSKGLLSNVNSINRKDSPFTGEDINDIALYV